MKRFVTAILLTAMLLASCGGSPDTEQAATTAVKNTSATSETETETTSPADLYGIKENDYGGMKICIFSGEHAEYEYMITEESGELVDDAVYARNRSVEELLNVKFTFESANNWTASSPFYGMIRTAVAAGDETYDIVNGLNVFTNPLIFEGQFRRLDNISTVDLSHPWWVPIELFDGSHRVYGAFSDASFSLYKELYVIFFNKTILEGNKLADPYDLVKSGKWTVDAFMEMAETGAKDLDGDGTLNINTDQYPYIYRLAANRAFLTSTGCSVIQLNDKGVPAFGPISERLFNVYEKLRPLLKDTQKRYKMDGSSSDYAKISLPFLEGRVLFMTTCLQTVEAMREMTDDYGIVPMPKYDEEQKDYHTQIATSTSAIYLPVTVSEPEKLGSVLEALGFYSRNDVVPAYYENALTFKYARDEEVRAMLDLVRRDSSTNIDFAYATSLSSTNDVISKAETDTDLMSWAASVENTVNAKIARCLEVKLEP